MNSTRYRENYEIDNISLKHPFTTFLLCFLHFCIPYFGSELKTVRP